MNSSGNSIDLESLSIIRSLLAQDGYDNKAIEASLSEISIPKPSEPQYRRFPQKHRIFRDDFSPLEANKNHSIKPEFLWKFSDEQILEHIIERFGENFSLDQYGFKSKAMHNRNGQQNHQRPNLNQQIRRQERRQDIFKGDCPICMDSLLSKPTIIPMNCTDKIHFECLEKYLVGQIDERKFPIKCPIPQCKTEISVEDIKNSLQTRLDYQKLYDDFSFQFYIDRNPENYKHCLTANCKNVVAWDGDNRHFACDVCKKDYCLVCGTDWHNGMTCEQYKQHKSNQGDDVFKNFATQMGYKNCPKCKFYVERNGGCNHMACTRCQTNFCYACGVNRDTNRCAH